MNKDIPRVGVGVIIKKENKVLLGERKGAHGESTWGFPGGHLEFLESVEDCARREVSEETGLELGEIEVHVFTNDLFTDENKHYITIYAVADWQSGDPQILEPDKCNAWEWHSWDTLPIPLFLPIQNLKKTDFDPFK